MIMNIVTMVMITKTIRTLIHTLVTMEKKMQVTRILMITQERQTIQVMMSILMPTSMPVVLILTVMILAIHTLMITKRPFCQVV